MDSLDFGIPFVLRNWFLNINLALFHTVNCFHFPNSRETIWGQLVIILTSIILEMQRKAYEA